MTGVQTLSATLLGAVVLCLTVGCTEAETPAAAVTTGPPQTPTPTATSSVKPHGIVGRSTDAWDCNTSPDVFAIPMTGLVTAVTLCRRDAGPNWQSRITVTDPKDLDWIVRLLSRDDDEPGPLDDCARHVPAEPPVLVQTTEGMWVVQTPKTACGVTLPHVARALHAIGVRAQYSPEPGA